MLLADGDETAVNESAVIVRISRPKSRCTIRTTRAAFLLSQLPLCQIRTRNIETLFFDKMSMISSRIYRLLNPNKVSARFESSFSASPFSGTLAALWMNEIFILKSRNPRRQLTPVRSVVKRMNFRFAGCDDQRNAICLVAQASLTEPSLPKREITWFVWTI